MIGGSLPAQLRSFRKVFGPKPAAGDLGEGCGDALDWVQIWDLAVRLGIGLTESENAQGGPVAIVASPARSLAYAFGVMIAGRVAAFLPRHALYGKEGSPLPVPKLLLCEKSSEDVARKLCGTDARLVWAEDLLCASADEARANELVDGLGPDSEAMLVWDEGGRPWVWIHGTILAMVKAVGETVGLGISDTLLIAGEPLADPVVLGTAVFLGLLANACVYMMGRDSHRSLRYTRSVSPTVLAGRPISCRRLADEAQEGARRRGPILGRAAECAAGRKTGLLGCLALLLGGRTRCVLTCSDTPKALSEGPGQFLRARVPQEVAILGTAITAGAMAVFRGRTGRGLVFEPLSSVEMRAGDDGSLLVTGPGTACRCPKIAPVHESSVAGEAVIAPFQGRLEGDGTIVVGDTNA